ncbi:pentatricopeptide repeat-containing protein At2g41720-like [Gossypium arboreum]|uniref:pentatricopeptide repeat-containing protein At2g41720-like n=1 Tax=Gossypium arboreum TaxID=29729 RepID=UPI0008197650|nr:pentatricopeptide repeat-containing protein At2g41720-like [Gossypium arboreum]
MTTLSHLLPIKFPLNSPTSTHSTTSKSLILCKKRNSDTAFEEHKSGFVDYDKVSTQVSGLRKAHIPKRYRLRVEGDRFQKDWTISAVVDRVMELSHWENVEPVLNRWVGRSARKNFPFLIKGSSGCSYWCSSRSSSRYPLKYLRYCTK